MLVVSAVLTGVASGAFGFSTSFPMAVFTRFLVGFFNGKITNHIKCVVHNSMIVGVSLSELSMLGS